MPLFAFCFQGQPSFVRVYRYPDFGGPAAAVANKSFYKADRVNMYWNKIGKDCVRVYVTACHHAKMPVWVLVEYPSQLKVGLFDDQTDL